MSPKSITEILPIEVIDIIIEHLAAPILHDEHGTDQDYTVALEDLKACALTCRKLRPLCQKQSFKTIDFSLHDVTGTIFENLATIARFAKVIEASPTIGSYARTLTLWLVGHGFYALDTMLSALRSFTNLRTLELHGWLNGFDWNDIPSPLIPEIYRLIQLPTITTIHIISIHNFDILSIAPCAGLQSLSLTNSSFGNISEDPSTSTMSPSRPIQLVHLEIEGYENPLLHQLMFSKYSDGTLAFNFECLKSFTIDFSFTTSIEALNAVSDFLQLGLPSLDTLELTFRDQDGIDAIFHHNTMKNVKNLTIACFSYGINDHQLPGICEQLQTLSRKNRIQVLRLRFTYRSGSRSDVGDDEDWDDLNNILLAAGWSSLIKVELQIICCSSPDLMERCTARAESLRALPETRLKGLASSRLFEFIWDFELKDQVYPIGLALPAPPDQTPP